MTPEQARQFEENGCACRCLIFLSNIENKPITRAQFVDRFSGIYPHWKTNKNCGATSTGMIFEIAKELGLAHEMTTYRDKPYVRALISSGKIGAVLLITEKKKAGDMVTSNSFHCQLLSLELPADGTWGVSQVDNNLNVGPAFAMSDAQIDEIEGYFLVLN